MIDLILLTVMTIMTALEIITVMTTMTDLQVTPPASYNISSPACHTCGRKRLAGPHFKAISTRIFLSERFFLKLLIEHQGFVVHFLNRLFIIRSLYRSHIQYLCWLKFWNILLGVFSVFLFPGDLDTHKPQMLLIRRV